MGEGYRLRVTRQGRDLHCRCKRVSRECSCTDCGQVMKEGDRVIRQGVSAGGRSHARRYCGSCAIVRGLALVAG